MRASNPDDQVFVVNFNDEYYLDQEFTGDIKKLSTRSKKWRRAAAPRSMTRLWPLRRLPEEERQVAKEVLSWSPMAKTMPAGDPGTGGS